MQRRGSREDGGAGGGFLPAQSLRSLSHRWVCLTTNFIASMKLTAEWRKLCSRTLTTKWLMEEEGTENRDGKMFLLRSAVDTVPLPKC